jgi:hypothetical protein
MNPCDMIRFPLVVTLKDVLEYAIANAKLTIVLNGAKKGNHKGKITYKVTNILIS